MALRRKQYAEELDKATERGKSAATAHRIASRLSSTTGPLGTKDKFDKPSMVDKFILKRLRRRKAKVATKAARAAAKEKREDAKYDKEMGY